MSLANTIRTLAATWPRGERAWDSSVERDVVRAFLMPDDAQGSVTDSQTFMLLVAEALDECDQLERLKTARTHAAQHASQWAMAARGHRSTVLEILRYFGLPENDWEALRLIQLAGIAGVPDASKGFKPMSLLPTTDEHAPVRAKFEKWCRDHDIDATPWMPGQPWVGYDNPRVQDYWTGFLAAHEYGVEGAKR